MTTALKRTGAALLTLLMFCMLTLGASAAANTPVGVKFWKEKSDKESMANSGIDSDREAILTRQSNGTYTLTLPVKQVTKLNVTGYLTGLTIGDVTYTGTLTGEIEKGNGILTIKNLPASVLTGSDVNKSLTVTCNIQMDLSLLGEINTTARMCIWQNKQHDNKSAVPPGTRFCCSAVDVLFHKVGGHFIQLHHRIFRALHHLAHIAAHLALALGSHHGTGSPKDCTGGHAHHHACGGIFSLFHPEFLLSACHDRACSAIISVKESGIRFFYAAICGILFYDAFYKPLCAAFQQGGFPICKNPLNPKRSFASTTCPAWAGAALR